LAASETPHPTLATYEDLGYRDVFWAARAYENACDRTALRAMLPPAGERLIEVGSGFGRLADEYKGYSEVVLLDSSRVHVEAALEALGQDPRFHVTLGDALALPFPDGYFDAAVCVRVLHHFRDPAPVIAELDESSGTEARSSSSTRTNATSSRSHGVCSVARTGRRSSSGRSSTSRSTTITPR
jgi:SAM-dependent methyltransferase